jgi:mRNA-degrading endonuclease toxin of MazEF toxin-antitoxin module
MNIIKNFLDWFSLKPTLDNRNHKPPLVEEGNIWWCHLGKNIGTEINGKSVQFTRPVIIFKKISRFTFLVVPASTQIKTGSWFVFFNHKNIDMVACLHQIRVVDYRRLSNKKGKLNDEDFTKIIEGFNHFYAK